MKKVVIALFLLTFLFISGCKDSITGKSVVDQTRIEECVRICGDDVSSKEELIKSCESILKYGGEELFNDYMNTCKK